MTQGLCFIAKLEYIDVVEIVEILSIESSKGDHTAPHEASAMSSPRLRMVLSIPTDFQALEGVTLDIYDKQIVKIVAESPCEHIDFIIIDCT